MSSPTYAKDLPSDTPNHIRNIAIVGSTGTVGKFIAAELLKLGKHNLIGITREGSSSKLPDGITPKPVNYDDPTTLVSALQGVDALIITMGTTVLATQQPKLIEAAATAGVEWIMPNEYSPDVVRRPDMGAEALLLDNVRNAHELVKKLGVSSYVGLSSGFWYPYSIVVSPGAFGFDIKNKKAYLTDYGETKTNVSTWAQSGRAVATLFSLPILPQDENDKSPCLSHWRNKQCHISSFFISQQDMLASLLRVTGDEESDWTVTYTPAKERYAEGQRMLAEEKTRYAGYVRCMYTRVFYKDGSGDFNDELDNETLGLPAEDFDEVTREAVKMVEDGWTYGGMRG